MKIRRLLHPTDFSSASRPAFELALELAGNRATLLLLHVLPPVPLVPDVYVAATVYERLRGAQEQSARKRLERLRLRAAAAGVRASALLRDSSSPAEEIVRVARAKRIETRKTFRPEDVVIREYRRFEGVSDPDDMAIVYAIEAAGGTRGTLIDAYGVYADPDVGAFLESVPIVERTR